MRAGLCACTQAHCPVDSLRLVFPSHRLGLRLFRVAALSAWEQTEHKRYDRVRNKPTICIWARLNHIKANAKHTPRSLFTVYNCIMRWSRSRFPRTNACMFCTDVVMCCSHAPSIGWRVCVLCLCGQHNHHCRYRTIANASYVQ